MKFISLLIVLVLSAISIGYSQPIDTIWTKTISYAPAGDATSYEMVKFNSNEFIVTGNNGDSLYIVKMTVTGGIVWEKYLYTDGGLFGAGIDKDENGNFYIIVWKRNFSNQWQLIKFNSSGDSLWSRTVLDPLHGFNIPYSMTVSSDYIYAAASAGNGPEKYMLYKFDPNGNNLYSTEYNVPGGFSIPRSITHDSNGNVIMAGTGGQGWYILKCNSDGDTLWSRTVSDNFWNNEARTVITDNNDNIICSGWVNKIIKYDPDGNLIFDKPLGGDTNWESASLINYDDGNVVSIGAKRRPTGLTYDLLMGKYSIDTGDSIWTKIWYYPETGFGVYGWDGAVFVNTSLIILAQTFTHIATNWYSNIYIISFSMSDIPVPVELTSFTAQTGNDGEVVLNWSTASETNNKGFEIERQVSSKQPAGGEVSPKGGYAVSSLWEKIGFVEGNGSTTNPKEYLFIDKNVSTGNYSYRLKQIDFDGKIRYSNEAEVNVNVSMTYSLSQNYPNPFNPTTTIEYSIPADGYVSLKIFNVIGQEIAVLVDGYLKGGNHTVNFDAADMASGVYYYKIESDNKILVKKMLLLK